MSEFNSFCHPFCRWEISHLVSDEARILTHTVRIEQMLLTHSRKFISWSKNQTFLNPEPENSVPGHFPRCRDPCLPMGCNNFIWIIRRKNLEFERSIFWDLKLDSTSFPGPDFSHYWTWPWTLSIYIQLRVAHGSEPEIQWLFLRGFYFKSLWVTNDLASFQHCASCGFSCQRVTYGQAWAL